MKLVNHTVKIRNNKKVFLKLAIYEQSDKKKMVNIYKQWVDLNQNLKNTLSATRGVNFPEGLSEPLVCLDFNLGKLISAKGSGYSSSFDCYDIRNEKRIQIKCSSSDGPTQFGPRSVQDFYYFVDFYSQKIIDGKYKIYKITNEQMKSVKVNTKQTMQQKADLTGQRPRFSIRSKIIKVNNLEPIFEGDLLN